MKRNKEQTIKRLLQAAGETIVFQGIDQRGLKATARRAGVDKALIYKYFGGWNGILEGLFQQLLVQLNPLSVTTHEPVAKAGELYTLQFYRVLATNPPFQVLLRWQIDNQQTVLGQRLSHLLEESIHAVAPMSSTGSCMLRLLIDGVTYSVFRQTYAGTYNLTEQAIRRIFTDLDLGYLNRQISNSSPA